MADKNETPEDNIEDNIDNKALVARGNKRSKLGWKAPWLKGKEYLASTLYDQKLQTTAMGMFWDYSTLNNHWSPLANDEFVRYNLYSGLTKVEEARAEMRRKADDVKRYKKALENWEQKGKQGNAPQTPISQESAQQLYLFEKMIESHAKNWEDMIKDLNGEQAQEYFSGKDNKPIIKIGEKLWRKIAEDPKKKISELPEIPARTIELLKENRLARTHNEVLKEWSESQAEGLEAMLN